MKFEEAMSGRWSRRLLAITGLTAAGLLLAAALTSHAGVEKASELVMRGQVATIFDAVRIRMHGARARGERPSDDDLDAVANGFKAAGLRYVALVGPKGEPVAHAGEAVGAPPTLPHGDARPFGRWTRIGDRVRVVIPFGEPAKGPPGRPGRPHPFGPPGGGGESRTRCPCRRGTWRAGDDRSGRGLGRRPTSAPRAASSCSSYSRRSPRSSRPRRTGRCGPASRGRRCW